MRLPLRSLVTELVIQPGWKVISVSRTGETRVSPAGAWAENKKTAATADNEGCASGAGLVL
ncbi:MAG: hypothetical protein NTX64_15290, partial [Elusimicrobia bacterium]|nr:hypothetical protein [Elusimicrobiota bacterium]